MSTSDTIGMTYPTAPVPPARRMRRSRTDRMGAGVAGGLGEYFRVDPVLFRVLFATAAFFGGAGVLAYLLAWAAIPEAGTERAAIDGWFAALRRRRIPFWLIVIVGSVLFWIVAFSWWAPGPFFPIIAVVILLVAVFGGRARRVAVDDASTVSLQKAAPVDGPKPAVDRPEWAHETRQWLRQSRQASRARARRAFPVKITTLLVLAAALVTLAVIDAAHGLRLPLYFWFTLVISAAGLLVGLVMRRTPWSISTLLIPAVIGLIAFAGTPTSLHDGVGRREWTPTSSLQPQYRIAFGHATLDLRSLRQQSLPGLVRVDQAAGQLRIIAPDTMNLTVVANVHIGVVTVDGEQPDDRDAGVSVRRTVEPLPTATGRPITIDVHLADGDVDISRR